MISTNNQQKSFLIIGGGITGLMAGTILQRHGINVTILDKGRGIGGRLATRRIRQPSSGQGIFDYGAQFFTVSDPTFQLWVDQWVQQGIITPWSNQLTETGTICYRGCDSNRSIAQYLAQNLEIHTQTRVTKIVWDGSQWRVETEQEKLFYGTRLILTPPVPQSLALLEDSAIAIPSLLKHRLAQVSYHPCLSVLALLDHKSLIPEPGGLRLKDASLAWIASNYQKGISPEGFAITLHSTPEFSQAYWDVDNEVVVEKLLKIASPWLNASVIDYQVHRWRYSHPKTVYGDLYLVLEEPGLLIMAGDGFSTTKAQDISLNLEKSMLSALAASHYCLNLEANTL